MIVALCIFHGETAPLSPPQPQAISTGHSVVCAASVSTFLPPRSRPRRLLIAEITGAIQSSSSRTKLISEDMTNGLTYRKMPPPRASRAPSQATIPQCPRWRMENNLLAKRVLYIRISTPALRFRSPPQESQSWLPQSIAACVERTLSVNAR